MIKALIVDSDQQSTEKLKSLLTRETSLDVRILTVNDMEECLEILPDNNPAIVFLDIGFLREPELSGAFLKFQSEVIFIARNLDHTLQALRFGAFDYLVKPIDIFELRSALKRYSQKIGGLEMKASEPENNSNERIRIIDQTNLKLAITSAEGLYYVSTDQIILCKADRNYTHFKLIDGRSFVSAKTLKEYDDHLTERGFIRVHKSFLINLNYIDSYLKKGVLLLKNGMEIPVARRRKIAVINALK